MPARSDPRLDAYIRQAAPFAQPVLRHLRALLRRECPAAVETIKWGMPHFEYGGAILCGMAAFKAHCAFWFWHHGMGKVIGSPAAGHAEGMGHFGRITGVADLPKAGVLRRYLRAAMGLADAGVPARSPQRGKRPEAKVPEDLAAALRQDANAARVFRKLSPSHRRDYIAWIEDAKRLETRARRVATTREWLAAGKARNWKYAAG